MEINEIIAQGKVLCDLSWQHLSIKSCADRSGEFMCVDIVMDITLFPGNVFVTGSCTGGSVQ